MCYAALLAETTSYPENVDEMNDTKRPNFAILMFTILNKIPAYQQSHPSRIVTKEKNGTPAPNQPTNQSINQSIHPSIDRTIIQYNQSINQTIYWSNATKPYGWLLKNCVTGF